MLSNKKLPGAGESCAGDDFHLLWASRKAMELLLPNSKLKLLSIEGPVGAESMLDIDGDKLLAIDLAEYYGGETFEKAEEVIVSQLKYSTRTPEKTWTASRICVSKNKNKTNSIVRRLAETFEFYYTYGRDKVLERLKIKLISNRPVNRKLKDALEVCQKNLKTKMIVSIDELVEKILPSGKEDKMLPSGKEDKMLSSRKKEIVKILEESNLSFDVFTDFLRVLDFSECGAESRIFQNIAFNEDLQKVGFQNTREEYSKIKSMIWDKMMPETTSEITKHDLLYAIGVTENQLFPCQPRFTENEKLIN